MAYTALQLANMALEKLGIPVLTGFTDAGAVATHVNSIFPGQFRILLKTADDWHWARKVAELTEDTVLTHYTEWDYAYDPPTGLLKVLDVMDQNGERVTWELQDAHIMSNYAAFTDADSNVWPRVKFVYDALTDTVGDGSGNPKLQTGMGTVMTEEWANAFAARLAWFLAIPITKDEKKATERRQDYLFVALPEAQRINATSSPGYGEDDGDWSDTPTS